MRGQKNIVIYIYIYVYYHADKNVGLSFSQYDQTMPVRQ